ISYKEMVTHYAAASERLMRGKSNLSSFVDPTTTAGLSSFADRFTDFKRLLEGKYRPFHYQFFTANRANRGMIRLREEALENMSKKGEKIPPVMYWNDEGLLSDSSTAKVVP